jgi:ubiquinone/menaquinone biosynthesis C-methylase UbiE
MEQASITDWAIGLLRIEPGDRVLDAGCGSGLGIQMMLRRKTGFVAGIDYSPAMVGRTRDRNAAAVDSGRCQVRQGDPAAIPYPEACFDKIMCLQTSQLWPDPLAVLVELRRVLAPEGRIAIAFENSAEGRGAFRKSHSAAQVAALMRQAGFEGVRSEYGAGRKWLYVEGAVS